MMTPEDFTQKDTHKELEDEELTLVGDDEVADKATEDVTGTVQESRRGGRVSKRPRKYIKSRIIRAPPKLRRSHRLHGSDEVRSQNTDGWEARACAPPAFAS